MAVTAVIQHQVGDYDTWRKAYDEFDVVQHRLGVTGESVHRATDDPNNVLVIHHFASAADADAFFASGELRDAMRDAGVQGAPRVEIYEDA